MVHKQSAIFVISDDRSIRLNQFCPIVNNFKFFLFKKIPKKYKNWGKGTNEIHLLALQKSCQPLAKSNQLKINLFECPWPYLKALRLS